jgi:aminomethyltransferase
MNDQMLRRTPLFDAHRKLGAKMIDFGGWEMPVQYSSIVDEHLAVRRNAGMFDISHMGEVLVSGSGAVRFLNRMLTNDINRLAIGEAQYTIMCNERGGAIDDLYAYRIGEDQFLLVINASRIEADVAWLSDHVKSEADVECKDVSTEFGAIAVQGPRVAEFIDKVIVGSSKRGTTVNRVTELKKNQAGIFAVSGSEIYVARTGYTGEDGFELITPAGLVEQLWEALLAHGHAHCLHPCGLGARDTLRTEVCYPLYGHELDEQTTPLEAGVGFFVALDKDDFIGRNVLLDQKAKGVAKRCVAFKMTEKTAPPRPGYPIWTSAADSSKVGVVTSGTQSPSLGIGIGLGYVPTNLAKPDTRIDIEIRGKRAPAVIVAKPIYRKEKTP